MSNLEHSTRGVSREILVIGSGFAAQQLIKSLRKLDAQHPIRLITADSGDEYNKPDLSHVVSRGSSAAAMTRQSGAEFAEQQRITLVPHCPVQGIDPARRTVLTAQGEYSYGQLVLATGATAVRPPIPGAEQLVTLNSQQEYAAIEARLQNAQRILVLGAGLIGCELAMDMASHGRQVTLVDQASSPLSSLLPAMLSQPLHQALQAQGVSLQLGLGIREITPRDPQRPDAGCRVILSDGRTSEQDLVIAAIGLKPNVQLAQAAGLSVGRGIQVDAGLRSSDPHIYALGDCAEVDGLNLLYVMPLMTCARALAQTLAGTPTAVSYGPMPVTVKTPVCPLVVSPPPRGREGSWSVEGSGADLKVLCRDDNGALLGYALTGTAVQEKLALNKELPALLA